MAKKQIVQQGMTSVVTPPPIPQSALVNPQIQAAQQAGLDVNSPLIVQQPTPPLSMTPPTTNTPASSGSFKRSDFPLGATGDYQYDQAKKKLNLPTPENIAAGQELAAKKQTDVNAVIQQDKIANLDPNLVAQAGQLGTQQPMTQQSQTNSNPLNIGEALKAGLVQGGEGALAGAAGGAAAGLVGSAGALSAPAAVLGAVGVGAAGFIRGFVNDLKSQTSKNIASNSVDLDTTKRNIRMLVTDTNQGGNAADNMAAFQAQLTAIDNSYQNLKMISKNKPLGENDIVELTKFENFYAAGGAREYFINEMQQAVYNPNPSKTLISADDITALE